MALFFLLIGLEIKRELMVGELSSLRKAAFPLVAAVGGVVVPVLFYLAVNLQQDGQLSGFGIPMATDIAFALGFLLLLGSRVPLTLKIFLTSLAVFDDLAAVILIALFYTSSIDLPSLGYAAATLVALVLLNRLGVKKLVPYLLLGILLWFWIEASGIHATIAGILLALTIPVGSRISGERFLDISRYELDAFGKHETNRKNILLTPEQQDSLEAIEDAYEAVQNPLVRLEHRLHPISAFFIIPLFAFANAGVQIAGGAFQLLSPVSLGIVLGLTLGKPLGIIGITYLTERLGWVQKPSSLSWKHIIGAGILGGVGFTMSIFITQLAFEDAAIIASAKLFIVACSLGMGIIGVLYLRSIKSEG
jgi:NhaA family Na+:H+ antiporter